MSGFGLRIPPFPAHWAGGGNRVAPTLGRYSCSCAGRFMDSQDQEVIVVDASYQGGASAVENRWLYTRSTEERRRWPSVPAGGRIHLVHAPGVLVLSTGSMFYRIAGHGAE